MQDKFLDKPIISKNVEERLSKDTAEDLKSALKPKTIWYQCILDLATVAEKLREWKSIAEIDNILPFSNFSSDNAFQRDIKNFKGTYRIWFLSREKGSKYYNGCYFDIRYLKYRNREKIIACRLSEESLNFLAQLQSRKMM